jgi:hypothetical protein
MGRRPTIQESKRAAAKQRREDTKRLKQQWLTAYVEIGWRAACAKVGCALSLPTYWRTHDKTFASDYAGCKAYQADRLEAVLDEAAAGERDISSPQMQALKFRLQGLEPGTYRDRVSIEQSGPGGGPIQIETGDAGRGMDLLERWCATD